MERASAATQQPTRLAARSAGGTEARSVKTAGPVGRSEPGDHEESGEDLERVEEGSGQDPLGQERPFGDSPENHPPERTTLPIPEERDR